MSTLVIVLAAASAASGLDPAWIAFLGAAFGGAGLKLTEAWLGRNKVKIDDATLIRDELRLDITSLRAENEALEKDRDSWREKYYTLYDTIIRYKTALAQYTKDEVDPPS